MPLTLPVITNLDPITKPAVAAVTYPHWFINQFTITPLAPDGTQRCMVEFRAYNHDTKQMSTLPGDSRVLAKPDIYAEAQRCPLLAQVMGGLITAFDLLQQESTLLVKIAAAAEGADTTALQSQLAVVRSALGIQQ